MACLHEDFSGNTVVNILEDGVFVADIKIWCDQCGEMMRFKGVPLGVAFNKPMASLDQTELRAPLEPSGVYLDNFKQQKDN